MQIKYWILGLDFNLYSIRPNANNFSLFSHISAVIGAYRRAWWLATLRHMAADDGGNMAE